MVLQVKMQRVMKCYIVMNISVAERASLQAVRGEVWCWPAAR